MLVSCIREPDKLKITVMCLSIGTPKNNKFQMENLLFLGVPKFGHITA